MTILKSLCSIMFTLLLTALILQGNNFAAEPSIIVTTDKPGYKVGEVTTFTLTGGPANTTIYWTTWTHDPSSNTLVLTSEVDAPIGSTDQYGNWKGSLSPWIGTQIGVRKRQAAIGNRKGFITFVVTPNLVTDKSVYSVAGAVGDQVLFTLTGGPPNTQIRWNTWLNDTQIITDAYYGQNTDSNGNWSELSQPYLPSYVGIWKQEVVTGNHRVSVEYTVVSKLTIDKATYQVNDKILYSVDLLRSLKSMT